MNRRTLSILLAYCLVNWFCVLLVSAEEDDTQIPPTIVTASTQDEQDEDPSIKIPKNDDSPSETNDTYPSDEYRLHDEKEQPLEDSTLPASDGEMETSSENWEDHGGMEEAEQDLGADVTSEITDERHEDEYVGGEQGNEDSSVIDATEEEPTEYSDEAETQQSDDLDPPAETDKLESEPMPLADEEGEDPNDTIESSEVIDDAGEDNRDDDVIDLDEVNNDESLQLDEEVEMNSSANDETTGETASLSPEQVQDTDTEYKGEQEDRVALDEKQAAEELDGQIEPNTDTEQDDSDGDTTSTMATETESETSSVGEEEPMGDATDDGDGTSTTPEESKDASDESVGGQIQGDSSDRTTIAESTPPTEESSQSIDENEIVDDESDSVVTNEGDIETEVMDTPSMEHTESTKSASTNQEMRESKEEEANDEPRNDGSEGPSYRGMWGTPMLGARPPDMELLYHVFETRIQKQLGIGPIPESELRENIFPLGIGFDEEDTADDETAPDGNDGSPPAQAKLQSLQNAGDVNSDFVEGLDDIDKFFEGVDPPDELDVGASGSSMQDMLMKKGKEILIKRFRMGIKIVRDGFVAAKDKVSARFSEIKKKDIDIQAIAKTAWSRTIQAYEALVGFVDGVLDFGNDDGAAEEDFEAFKKKTMEEMQQQEFTTDT
mmetsp:Transcript_32663/g.79206  ORF Transcript_32663/g.79206 Transcript_32663/m.79206 type:complete len:665 (+) Transcript_32663:61-2055(+)